MHGPASAHRGALRSTVAEVGGRAKPGSEQLMPFSSKTTKLGVLIVAPSLDILGGQSVQAARLLDRLSQEPGLEAGFLPVNPRLPGVLRKLQSAKFVRPCVTSVACPASPFDRAWKCDVIPIFSTSYFSFVLA